MEQFCWCKVVVLVDLENQRSKKMMMIKKKITIEGGEVKEEEGCGRRGGEGFHHVFVKSATILDCIWLKRMHVAYSEKIFCQ
jgi:hypothetical protein